MPAPPDTPQPPRPNLWAALTEYRAARRLRAHMDAAVEHREHLDDPAPASAWSHPTDPREDRALVVWALAGWGMAIVGVLLPSIALAATGMVVHLAAVARFLLATSARE